MPSIPLPQALHSAGNSLHRRQKNRQAEGRPQIQKHFAAHCLPDAVQGFTQKYIRSFHSKKKMGILPVRWIILFDAA